MQLFNVSMFNTSKGIILLEDGRAHDRAPDKIDCDPYRANASLP